MGLLIGLFAKLGLGQRLAGAAAYLTLFLALGGLVWGLWARGDHYRDQRDLARGQLREQVAEYRAAYRKAFIVAWQAKRAEEARQSRIKEESDNALHHDQADADDRAAAYADSHRCVQQPARADPGPAGTAGVPEAARGAGKPAERTDDAELVAISRADLAICTANSIRLRNAWEWGQQALTAPPD